MRPSDPGGEPTVNVPPGTNRDVKRADAINTCSA